MSGGLFANMLLRETGLAFEEDRIERLQRRHGEAYRRNIGSVRPLAGARDLLNALTEAKIPFAIATSGRDEGSAGRRSTSIGIDFGSGRRSSHAIKVELRETGT